MKVFLVLHHEIMGTPDDCHANEMVFYTCHSMNKALELIKRSSVARWSWWEVQEQEMDSLQWPQHVGYFGRRGGKLATSPYERCLEIFKTEA